MENKENIKITILERDNYKYAIVNIWIREGSNITEIKLIVPKSIIKSIEKKLIIKDAYNDINSFAKSILDVKFNDSTKSLIDLYKSLNIDEIEEAVKRLKNFL